MQDTINRFSEWCKKVKLNINVQKTKTMCFTTKRDNIPDLKLNGEIIETVNEFKYLGMTLDAPYLTWKPHIGKIVTNSLKTINHFSTMMSLGRSRGHNYPLEL